MSSFQILAMFRRGLFYSYLAIYLRQFLGLSVTETTLFASLPMILNVLSQRYLWGVFSDKYQRRRSMVIWGEVLAGIGTIILWYLHLIPRDKIYSGWIIIVGLTVIEVFWSMSNIGWSALISDIYDEKERGHIMGKLESLGGVGRMAGILAGGLLYDKMGTEYAGWGFRNGALFFISGAIMFLSVFPMLTVPEGGIRSEERDVVEDTERSEGVRRSFAIFLISMVLINFGRNSIAVIMAPYLTLESGFNLSPLTLSYFANTRSLGIIFAGFLTGWILKKTGPENLLIWGSVAAASSLFLFGAADMLFNVGVGNLLLGISDVVIMASSYQIASSYIPPEKRGKLFSVFNATFFLSWGIGATCITGPIVDFLIAIGCLQTFAYRISFSVAGIIVLFGIALLFLLFRSEKEARKT